MKVSFVRTIAALAWFSGSLSAQAGTITGIVSDKATSQPIEGARVVVSGTMAGTMTKADGSFRILGVPPGRFNVTAKRDGYQGVEIANVIIEVDVNRTLNIQLDRGPMVERGVVGGVPQSSRTPPADPVIEQGQVGASFESSLYPPELIMQQQRMLALTADQRRTITEAVKALTNQTVDLQWNLQAEQQTLTSLLDRRPINEAAAVAQMSKLLELEDAVKRTHLATLIKIKNALTPQQIALLNEVRRQPQREFEFDWKLGEILAPKR